MHLISFYPNSILFLEFVSVAVFTYFSGQYLFAFRFQYFSRLFSHVILFVFSITVFSHFRALLFISAYKCFNISVLIFQYFSRLFSTLIFHHDFTTFEYSIFFFFCNFFQYFGRFSNLIFHMTICL